MKPVIFLSKWAESSKVISGNTLCTRLCERTETFFMFREFLSVILFLSLFEKIACLMSDLEQFLQF